MSKPEGHRGRLEPPKRDYKPATVAGARPSLWQRLFGKRVEPHKQVRTVATQPKHHVATQPRKDAKGAGDRAGPARVDVSRRSALAGLAGFAALPAASAALEQQSSVMRAAARLHDATDAFANRYNRNSVYTTFAEPQVVTTMPLHEHGFTSYLDVPAGDLLDAPTAGQVIKWRGKHWLVLAGGYVAATDSYMLQARAVR